MLVLRRKNGQWTKVTHKATSQTFSFRVYDIQPDGTFQVAFDDLPLPTNQFIFDRPEAKPRVEQLEKR